MAIRSNLSFIICILILSAVTGCTAYERPTQNDPWNQANTSPSIPAPTRETTSQKPIPTKPTVKPNQVGGTVNVAILLPLSGPKAALGQSMLQAAQLALFDIGNNNFNLIPRDTKGTAQGASTAAQSAINDGAQLILGPLFADSVRATQAVAQSRNVNLIAFSTDASLANKNSFLMGFMPSSQVDRITNYALSNGYKDFALIAPKDTYGNIVSAKFNQSVASRAGNITKTIRFNGTDPAITNEIAKLKGSSVQAVFMPMGGTQADMVASALTYHTLYPKDVRRLGTGLWDNPQIAQLQNLNGGWFAAPSPQKRANFDQRYADTYGQRPIRIASLAYDATALAAVLAQNGIQRSGRADFSSNAITNPNGFAGVDGVFRFGRDGIVQRNLAILEINNGQIKEIDAAADRF